MYKNIDNSQKTHKAPRFLMIDEKCKKKMTGQTKNGSDKTNNRVNI